MKIDERKIRSRNSAGRHNPALKEDAERLAIAALGFVAGDPGRLEGFLALTGLNLASLRQAAVEPGFFQAVLEHVCADERLLLDFAAQQRCDPHAIAAARRVLAGEEAEMP